MNDEQELRVREFLFTQNEIEEDIKAQKKILQLTKVFAHDATKKEQRIDNAIQVY